MNKQIFTVPRQSNNYLEISFRYCIASEMEPGQGFSFPCHSVKVRCQFCKLEMLRKNYNKHLERNHPDANSQNLCGLGQKSVGDFFSPSKEKSLRSGEEDIVTEQEGNRDELVVVENDAASESETSVHLGKRRHATGDSA